MTDFLQDWQAYADRREERLRSAVGYLAITAIHWLSTTPERFTDVPGQWCQDERGTTVTLAPGETLTLDDDVLTTGPHVLGPLDYTGLTISFDGGTAEVADRGGTAIVRPRRPDSATLRAYRGTPRYPADARWVLSGRFEPYDEPVAAPDAVGEVVFEHEGAGHRLVAWGEDDGSLWILFRDATSGVTTYPANRQILVAPPTPDGTVTIDFNRAINMPCAYTDFVTCPLPPAANTLPFAVEAGEQVPTMADADRVPSGTDGERQTVSGGPSRRR
ncbi:DUF1684 domain-containing protein [Nocardioides guangzhouensis]|uniref:DUF1684 domain-containing protein n=1 Tax=Nocardioides guangzhouensis TaxID=2497878 RepID=UPI001FEAD983|nr:DUF1684 domain-containing protein [Nocardioides guangzhouensis]